MERKSPVSVWPIQWPYLPNADIHALFTTSSDLYTRLSGEDGPAVCFTLQKENVGKIYSKLEQMNSGAWGMCYSPHPMHVELQHPFFFVVKTGAQRTRQLGTAGMAHTPKQRSSPARPSLALSLTVSNWFRGQAIKIDVSAPQLWHQESCSGIMWRKTPAYYRGTIKYLEHPDTVVIYSC